MVMLRLNWMRQLGTNCSRKLFEVPNIQLQVAVTTARAWEMARRQASNIAGSVTGSESGGVNALKVVGKRGRGAGAKRGRGRGGKHDKDDLRNASGSQHLACFACGKVGHFARDKECPARGRTCGKCGKKGHWAKCCRLRKATDNPDDENVHRVQFEDNVVALEWDDDDSYAFSVAFAAGSGRPGNENVVPVKLNGVPVEMLVDSGAQSTVLGEEQFSLLRRKGLKSELVPDNRTLRVYGNSLLPVVGSFRAVITCYGHQVEEDVLVTKGTGQCLLGSQAAKRLQVLKVWKMVEEGINTIHAVGIPDQFPKVFNGIGKLSGYQLSLHIDPSVMPVAQKPRRIPFPLKERVMNKIGELLKLDVIEKVNGPTTWVSPAVFAPKPGKNDIRVCVDMRCANKEIAREKLPIPQFQRLMKCWKSLMAVQSFQNWT